MADEFSIDISGIQETQRKIFKFSQALGDRVTLLALRSGANFMLKQIRLAAPKKTGRLRRAIVVKNSRINRIRRNGRVGVYITIKPGKHRHDPKGAYYGSFVEHGHGFGKKTKLGFFRRVFTGAKNKSRLKIAGKFFVKNTFNRTKKQAVQLVIKNIENAGKQLAKKLV